MDELEKNFDELLVRLKKDGPSRVGEMKKAWDFCKIAHAGQSRKNGEPYASHPLATVCIVVEWKLDGTSIIAGFLHDTIEDAGVTREEIEKEFGEDVALLVDGVTKVSRVKLKNKKSEVTVENLRKLVLVMSKDLRVVFVKLADRLHNMRTLEHLEEGNRKRISKETLEIYAPLAERIGMGEVKGELEDLAFKYSNSAEYEKVNKEFRQEYEKVEEHILKMEKRIIRRLSDEGVSAEIHARVKHYYSLWKKLQKDLINGNYKKIHDTVALRILVDNKRECYIALGILHELYKPFSHSGVRDHIAQPKPNGYQSIHANVFGPSDRVVEVQIRTHEMHEQAEYGAAAHWAYSEVKSLGASDEILEEKSIHVEKSKLNWVKELAKWQDEITDSDEYLKAVKFDALSHRIFVFSPTGDVYDMLEGATPIDFACAVHTDLCHFLKFAKVNGNMVPLSYELKSGDVVEIAKQKKKRMPGRDWLSLAKTMTAKREIRKMLHG